ncbi:MAG: hypothetical protein ACM3NF_09550 [Gemmatimonadota bacterium]
MEGILIDVSATTFGAFIGMTALLFVVAGILLAGVAEGEAAGARYTWAEWPLPETVAPPEKAKLRLVA